jgi:CheY-like chemotaxis protein
MARDILVADPNKAAHKAFEEIFKETNYNLIFSENGEDALLKMKLFKPALVIADVTMPDKSGKELCQMLKGDPELNQVPFVLLGGAFDEDIDEEKNQVKADGTITKPLKRESILKLVDGLLTGETAEGTQEAEEGIMELQPIDEVAEAISSGGDAEVIDLVDMIEEPAAKHEEPPLGPPAQALETAGTREVEEAAILGKEALADLELPEDMGLERGEEAIQAPEMEGPEVKSGLAPGLEAEPAKMEERISAEGEMAGLDAVEEQRPVPSEGPAEPEELELGAAGVMEGLPTEEMGEVPPDILKEAGLEEPLPKVEGLQPGGPPESEGLELGAEGVTEELSPEGLAEVAREIREEMGLEEALAAKAEELAEEGPAEPEGLELGVEGVTEELPTEGLGEVPQDILKERDLEETLAEEVEELPEEGSVEPEGLELGVEGVTEELPTEGLGEVPQDILKEKGLEEALAEEIEELPGDLLGERDLEEPPAERKVRPGEEELEFEELGGLGQEDKAPAEEEQILEDALRELPGDTLEESELEKLSGGEISTEEFEWESPKVSREMDLDGLAQKVLKEEDVPTVGEEGLKEEEFEEVFKEGELEKLAVEATRDQESEEIPEGALAEAIEEFTGEPVRRGAELGVRASRRGPIEETISGAIKEMVEGMSVQLTEAISAAAVETIEKTVQKIVPEMAEKAIQKEIQRLEDLKKGEDVDV